MKRCVDNRADSRADRRAVGRIARTGRTWLLALATAAILLPGGTALAQETTASATRAPRWDWTADRRRFGEGDVITVLIDEYTLASANKSSQALRDNKRKSSLSGHVDSGTGIGAGASVGYGSGNLGESRERGNTTRSDRLTTEMTVRVVAVTANGTLQVEGRKKLLIDEHEQEVTLRGYLRPEDVSARNVVDSGRLADAEIAYTSNGKLDRPRGGILSRIFGKLWP